MGKDAPEAKLATLHAHDGDTRLRLAIEEAGLATWDTNFFTGESIWSANHYRLFGYPVDPTGRATVEMWSSRLHPEDRERVLAHIERAKRERAPYRSEYRIVRADTGDMKIYVGGALEAEGRGPAGTRSAPDRIAVGRLQTGINRFEGSLDDLRFYSRALTDVDVRLLSTK